MIDFASAFSSDSCIFCGGNLIRDDVDYLDSHRKCVYKLCDHCGSSVVDEYFDSLIVCKRFSGSFADKYVVDLRIDF